MSIKLRKRCTGVVLSGTILISLMACTGATHSGPASQSVPPNESKRLAVIDGQTVTEEQVKNAAANELDNLEVKKVQAQVEFAREEHSIYERALKGIVDNKVIEAEAKKRGIAPSALIQLEVDAKVPIPSDKDVNSFYEQNKARINVSGEEALVQIRNYLRQQGRDAVYEEFIGKARQGYNVQTFLEPLRSQIVTQGFPARGTATAPVTIVEFSDFECPYCAAVFPTLKQVEAKYGDKVRVVFRQFPLTSIHPHAQKAAEASLCANDQKKFWELHDAMFQDNRNLDLEALKKKASNLKLDSKLFDSCLDTGKHADAVKKDVSEGTKIGVTGTPALFINGRFLNGAQPYAEIAKIVDEELQK